MSLIFILSGCNFAKNKNEVEENNLIFKEDSYKELQTKINIDEVVSQINMSKTNDNGYRFCNLEFLNKSDPYSTYYINSIKRLYNNNDINSQSIKNYFINKLEDSTLDNLVDVYYSVLLINDEKAISKLTKDKIQQYLNSLYNENGYYSIQPNVEHSVLDAMLSTHYVIITSRSLNIENKNIDKWLNEVEIALLADENMIPQNSGLYLLYYKILESLNKEIPENMFQNFINKLNEYILDNKIDVYTPDFYSDFIYLSEQFSHDYNHVKKEILNSVIKDSVLDKDNINIYDSYSIYETLGVLTSLNYDVGNLFEESIDYFNKFELYGSLYITPGEVEGNFLDTYYVIRVMELIGVDNDFDTCSYIETMKNEILQGDPVQVDLFIQYLSDSGNLSILDDIKMDLIDYIRTVINHVLETEYEWAYKIKYLNAAINSISILTKEEIDESTKKEIIDIIKEEKLSSDVIQNITENCELYELMYNLKFNNKSKDKVLGEIDKNIVKISKIEMTGKVSLLEKVYKVYGISGEEKPTSLKNLAIDVLELSIHESGLFKGGDSNADIISFQYIHDSLQLISSINEGSLK
ncbi:MAG: hypothetical protein K0S61_2793 [Anaerocolumna sp.]|nr:hypothetical protein [Anaerocolumna sp.]